MKSFFVIGTDTGCGKTFATTSLIHSLNHAGYHAFGMKPLASGCEKNAENQWVNDDALRLQRASFTNIPYAAINPIALPQAVAPHLAANIANITLSAEAMITAIQGTQNQIQADYCMIESIGGWFVPLNANETVANVITILQYPVILVVGIKLGCLNHALLTVKQIEQTNIPFIGWIANEIDPNMQMKDENITTLKQWIKAPHLGTIAFNELHPKLDYHALID